MLGVKVCGSERVEGGSGQWTRYRECVVAICERLKVLRRVARSGVE